MAAGSIIGGGITSAAFGSANFDATRTSIDLAVGEAYAGPIAPGGPATNTQPIAENPVSFAGSRQRTFVDDYYGRIHFSALRFDLGNIIAGVSRVLTIWNSYLTPKTIEISTSSGTAGVSVSGLASSGTNTLRPLEQDTTTFSILTSGDPLLRARYTFTIDDPA